MARVLFWPNRMLAFKCKSILNLASEILSAAQVVVATGSTARPLPDVPFDEDRVLSNDGALSMADVPKKLAIIGAGVIGLEMGSVWARLGAQVTILEGLPSLLGAADEQIAKEASKALPSKVCASNWASSWAL